MRYKPNRKIFFSILERPLIKYLILLLYICFEDKNSPFQISRKLFRKKKQYLRSNVSRKISKLLACVVCCAALCFVCSLQHQPKLYWLILSFSTLLAVLCSVGLCWCGVRASFGLTTLSHAWTGAALCVLTTWCWPLCKH